MGGHQARHVVYALGDSLRTHTSAVRDPLTPALVAVALPALSTSSRARSEPRRGHCVCTQPSRCMNPPTHTHAP
eukprot:184622-Chlamydomonas_euryale.AAC.3